MVKFKYRDKVKITWIDATTCQFEYVEVKDISYEQSNWSTAESVLDSCNNPYYIESVGYYVAKGKYYTAISHSACKDKDTLNPLLIPNSAIYKIRKLK